MRKSQKIKFKNEKKSEEIEKDFDVPLFFYILRDEKIYIVFLYKISR